ncbi:MAG: hypothetical protein GW748_04210 [Alphaproteobacteria bacterium]|nr:hypothetical protein [Alphaproteobacteria bacterium]NCQ66927.1 hypothetical protein [Alphaproteobacteria bacterium]NCT07494.1 hypothetical protein [Alphaproteobacteria bacterium]
MIYLVCRRVFFGLFLTLSAPSYSSYFDNSSASEGDISDYRRRSIVKPLTLFLINPLSKTEQTWQNDHVFLLGQLTHPRHFKALMDAVAGAGKHFSRGRGYSDADQFSVAQFFLKPLIKRLQEIKGETYKKKGVFKALFREITPRRFYNDFVQSLLLTNENDRNFNTYVIPVFFDFLERRSGFQTLYETSERLYRAAGSDRSLSWLGYRGFAVLIQDRDSPLEWRFKALRAYRDKTPNDPKIFSKYCYCRKYFFGEKSCDETTKILSALLFVDDYEFLMPLEQEQVAGFLSETDFTQLGLSFQREIAEYFVSFSMDKALKEKGIFMLASLLGKAERGDFTLQRKIGVARQLLCEPAVEYGKAAYDFLLGILSDGNLTEYHEKAALIIAQNLDKSPHIEENSESFQSVIFLLSKLRSARMGLSYSDDPYAVYGALKKKRQENVWHRPLAHEGLVFLPHLLMRSPEIPSFPEVTHEGFCILIDELLSDCATHNETFESLGGTLALRLNIGVQKTHVYFIKQFASLEKDRESPVTLDPVSIHLALALSKIQNFSSIDEEDGFSPRTRAMMQFMVNVLTCSGGKSVGITHSSHLLCEDESLQIYDEDEIESELNEKHFRNLLEHHLFLRILGVLNGEGALVRALTETPADKKVHEPPHQTIYLKNLLAPSLPFLHFKGQGAQLKFDINAGCASTALMEKTHQDVLDAFYRQISPVFILKVVQNFVNDHYGNPVVAAGIGASGLMNKEGYVDFEDKTYRPIINLKGIVALLIHYCYFEKTDNISLLGYNNLVVDLKEKNS